MKEISIVQGAGHPVARVKSEAILISGAQSALDLIAQVWYAVHCDRMIVEKSAVSEALFDLRTGIAGEVLQKFSNYRAKLAIIGDFSGYASKSLAAFIFECNRGGDILFLDDETEAVSRLGG
ncbi:MAG: DUF4180 domain-containing protein [Eubacteriales bacterium]|nr:DUF4180 domain-containing protein [Eubacteriales bacterium]